MSGPDTVIGQRVCHSAKIRSQNLSSFFASWACLKRGQFSSRYLSCSPVFQFGLEGFAVLGFSAGIGNGKSESELQIEANEDQGERVGERAASTIKSRLIYFFIGSRQVLRLTVLPSKLRKYCLLTPYCNLWDQIKTLCMRKNEAHHAIVIQ